MFFLFTITLSFTDQAGPGWLLELEIAPDNWAITISLK